MDTGIMIHDYILNVISPGFCLRFVRW